MNIKWCCRYSWLKRLKSSIAQDYFGVFNACMCVFFFQQFIGMRNNTDFRSTTAMTVSSSGTHVYIGTAEGTLVSVGVTTSFPDIFEVSSWAGCEIIIYHHDLTNILGTKEPMLRKYPPLPLPLLPTSPRFIMLYIYIYIRALI